MTTSEHETPEHDPASEANASSMEGATDQATTDEQPLAQEAEEIRDEPRESVDRAEYWQEIYEESEDHSPGWNLGEPNPELVWRLANDKPAIPPGSVLVPGCGYGHDALALAQAGFEVSALDFAPMALEGARQAFADAGLSGEFIQSSVFDLGRDYDARFDFIFEHTCFCAIHPERRAEYAQLAARVLKPGGQLIGVFYYHGREGGPPWNTTPEQVREAFEPSFECRTLVVAQRSVERRAGKELWARFFLKG